MNLRKLAQGQDCMVRIGGVCNRNPETVILAHLNMIGISGRGLKSPDQIAAWCCSSCHDEVDGRTHNYWKWKEEDYLDEEVKMEIEHMFYQGIFRTQALLIKRGAIK